MPSFSLAGLVFVCTSNKNKGQEKSQKIRKSHCEAINLALRIISVTRKYSYFKRLLIFLVSCISMTV